MGQVEFMLKLCRLMSYSFCVANRSLFRHNGRAGSSEVRRNVNRRSVRLRILCALFVGGVVPQAAQAQPPRVSPVGEDSVVRAPQVQPHGIAPVDEEKLRAYAQAYVEIAKAQDQIHAELARPSNKTSQALTILRERIREQVSEILVEAGLTLAEYREITYVVSIDGPRRQAFEQILTHLGVTTERG